MATRTGHRRGIGKLYTIPKERQIKDGQLGLNALLTLDAMNTRHKLQ